MKDVEKNEGAFMDLLKECLDKSGYFHDNYCKWIYVKRNDNHETECGMLYGFEYKGNFNYCPYCGKKIYCA